MESCENQVLLFDLTSVVDALSTRPLNGIVTTKLYANISKWILMEELCILST